VRLSRDVVGAREGPVVREIDARWLMAYAAAVGATGPAYLDTTRADGLVAHPLFPVCYEWPLAEAIRAARFAPEIAARSVHATHDVVLHRLPRPGDRLATVATVVGLEPRPPGAYVLTRHDTTDAAGAAVSTTLYGSLHRGVTCDANGAPGADARDAARSAAVVTDPAPLPPPAGDPAWMDLVEVPASLAHTYTECARIWNPIHTDRSVALRAGLPDIILHGTATLALAITKVLERHPGLDAPAVRRVRGRFAAMVRVPATLRVEAWTEIATGPGRAIPFRVLTADGRPALRDGWIELRPHP
jgi:acyl dehydratase